MKQISIDALNMHLFETIEGLKNNSDPLASPNEKIDIDTAKAIGDIGKVIVDGYKVKAQVLHLLSRSENPTNTKALAEGLGIFDNENSNLELGE